MATRGKNTFYGWFLGIIGWGVLFVISLWVAFELYNPYAWNKRAGKPYQTVRWVNPGIVGIPNNIFVQYNNIGCVGPHYEAETDTDRIFFVGSSTTKNALTPFDKQWMSVAMRGIPAWYNSVGVNGTSAREWTEMVLSLKAYKPKYIVVLFAVGKQKKPPRLWREPFTRLSWLRETALMKSLVLPFVESLRNGNKDNDMKIVRWREIPERTQPDKMVDTLHVTTMIKEASWLIDEIRNIGATPILISQPTPFGQYMADGRDVGKMVDSDYIDGIYKQLSMRLKILCLQKEVNFIDGYTFPKSFEYYYDIEHFNIHGNIQFGEYIHDSLRQYITVREENKYN